jgi:hypothetical protein
MAPTAGSKRVLDFITRSSAHTSATVTTVTAAAAAAASAASSTMTLYSGSSTQPPVLSIQAAQHTASATTTASVSTITVELTVGPRSGSSYREHALLTDGWTGVPRVMSWQWPVACHSSSYWSTSCICTTRCGSSGCGTAVAAAVALAGWSDGCIDVIPVHGAADSATATVATTIAATGKYDTQCTHKISHATITCLLYDTITCCTGDTVDCVVCIKQRSCCIAT